MADVGYIAIVVAGFGAYWWQHFRAARGRSKVSDLFAPDAEIALHVASHEAKVRRQELSSVHVLYGLLQDETITAAIATAGGSAEALEDRVLAALATPVSDPQGDIHRSLGLAAAIARQAGRQVTCTDLWAYLGNSHAAKLVGDAKLDRAATLFALFHGGREPEVTLGDGRDVLVVIRNDDYTTHEFVAGMLREVFALPEAEAAALTAATHTTGRAVIGRFSATTARSKIHEARTRAHAQHFPLWIGIEPA